ncbi:MAG: MFS transporter [Sphingorhabdus sp.]
MAATLDIATDAKGSPHFYRVLFLCACIALLDGYDTQAIAFVAPVLGKAWGVSKEAFGLAFASALIGLMVGTTLFGPLADKIGRKPVLTLATAIFAIFSIATAWSTNMTELALWRFLTGIGLGAAIPNLIALTSEHAPGNRRALAMGTMFCGFPLGAMLCGLISPALIKGYGWSSIFILGGVLPLLFVPIAHFFLVESPAWSNRAERGQIAKAPVRALFGKDLIGITPLLWLTFFCSLLAMYFLINWLPTIFTEAGQSLEQATRTTVILNVGGILGGLCLTPLIDRFGARAVLPHAYALGALAIGLIGVSQPGSTAIIVAILFAGVGIVGGQLGANAYTANIHPTEMRATGVGWALGIGRIGSIVGPIVGGILLGTGMATGDLFLAVAAVASVAAFMLFIVTRKRYG